MGFKARVDPFLVCFVTCVQWIPALFIDGYHGSRDFLIHILVHVPGVVRKCFIKHKCFIVLYFHGHDFFLLEIALLCFFSEKMCFFFW